MEINGLPRDASAGRVEGSPAEGAPRRTGRRSPCESACSFTIDLAFPEDRKVAEAREERVAGLKAAIAAGTYNPDPAHVARKVLGIE